MQHMRNTDVSQIVGVMDWLIYIGAVWLLFHLVQDINAFLSIHAVFCEEHRYKEVDCHCMGARLSNWSIEVGMQL